MVIFIVSYWLLLICFIIDYFVAVHHGLLLLVIGC